MMSEITYSDLRRARSAVIKQAGVVNVGKGSMDTMTPMVRSGLEVVEFGVDEALQFAREITSKNLFRISIAKGSYAIDLFTACYASGMTTGSMTERRRHAKR
jgi:hypothetical protein